MLDDEFLESWIEKYAHFTYRLLHWVFLCMDQVLPHLLLLLLLVDIMVEEESGQIDQDTRWIIDPRRLLSRMFQRMQRMTYALILLYVMA